MGGRFILGLNRELREAARVAVGERVAVELELDDEPRVVEAPADLAAALDADPAVRAAFDRLSYTHRKEYVRWVEEAKREETRLSRIEKTVAMIRDGVKTPG